MLHKGGRGGEWHRFGLKNYCIRASTWTLACYFCCVVCARVCIMLFMVWLYAGLVGVLLVLVRLFSLYVCVCLFFCVWVSLFLFLFFVFLFFDLYLFACLPPPFSSNLIFIYLLLILSCHHHPIPFPFLLFGFSPISFTTVCSHSLRLSNSLIPSFSYNLFCPRFFPISLASQGVLD